MKIAFYAPLKSPDHPVPSGDRLMARLLVAAFEAAGAEVEVVSEFRSFTREPSGVRFAELKAAALDEAERIASGWQRGGAPDLWFTYHPYYKAADLIGPYVARRFAIPYLTAEASYSRKRDGQGWREMQAHVADAVAQAAVNICLTERDRLGLIEAIPNARTARLPPFLDASLFLAIEPLPNPRRLVTIAMMRPGDKMDSYRMLAASLACLQDVLWTLEIVGDGPCRAEVETLFADFGPDRVLWCGERDRVEIANILSRGSIYLWPGCGEAYGLAYLEAQAAGLPVVAQAIAGVPEVVMEGRTGLLTAPGDIDAYAGAIRALLEDGGKRERMALDARRFAADERSLEKAAARLSDIIADFTGMKI